MSNHTQLKAMLIENEGNLPHMYLDTVGRVTVGVGHMIPASAQALRIQFVIRGALTAATPQQISTDFENVSRQHPAMAASSYRPFTQLEMTPTAVDALLNADIAGMEAGLRTNFSNYDSYPESVQDALLDMAFNLGVHGLVEHFPHLKAAAESRDWRTCAAQSHRNGISDARNQKTAALFLSAV
jgi:GH24 family phage-related lysozyme (muramidase)